MLHASFKSIGKPTEINDPYAQRVLVMADDESK